MKGVKARINLLAILFLFCVPGIFGMWSQSMWIDEAVAVFLLPTQDASFVTLLKNLHALGGSVVLTPLHTLSIALWARLVPSTELWLRLSNLPFLAGTAWLCVSWMNEMEIRGARRRLLGFVLVATAPLYTYYTVELRPYAAMIFYGGAITYGMALLELGSKKGAWIAVIGLTLASLTQPFTVFLAPALLFGCWNFVRARPRDFFKLVGLPVLSMLPFLIGVGCYYLWAVQLGKTGGALFEAKPNIGSVLYLIYEFTGFAGLGPPRQALRSLDPLIKTSSVSPYSLFSPIHWALCGGLILSWVFFAATCVKKQLLPGQNAFRAVALKWSVILCGGFLVVLLGYFFTRQSRFPPRYLALAFMPGMLGILTLAIEPSASRWRLMAASSLAAFFTISSMRLLFLPAYGRDDFKNLIHWVEAEGRRDPQMETWIATQTFPLIFYAPDGSFVTLDGPDFFVTERNGKCAFRKIPLSKKDLSHPSPSNLFCIHNPEFGFFRDWVHTKGHAKVRIAFVRGADFDQFGRLRNLLSADSKVIATFPFISVYQVDLSRLPVNWDQESVDESKKDFPLK